MGSKTSKPKPSFKKSFHLKFDRRRRFITKKLIRLALDNGKVINQEDGKVKILLEKQNLVIVVNKDRSLVVTSYWKSKKYENLHVDSLVQQAIDECKTIDELIEFGDLDEEHARIFDKKVNAAIKPHTFSKLINWIMK